MSDTVTGVPTSLMTGQQKREVENAMHSSCTVEMADTSRRVECAVIDEIQMMADPDRGWAWTRALLGVPALTLHVCGSPSAVVCAAISMTLGSYIFSLSALLYLCS